MACACRCAERRLQGTLAEETIKQADPSRSPPPRRRDANGGKPVPASAERETAKSGKEKPPEGGGKTVKLRRGQNCTAWRWSSSATASAGAKSPR